MKLEPLFTNKGSKIWYSKFGVGKQVGSKIYVHKNYVTDIIPINIWNKAISIIQKHEPQFNFNCICYNLKNPNMVRFDEAPNFDIANEPYVGTMITINTLIEEEKSYKIGYTNQIWHGKWLWVKENYNDFSVEKSWEWNKYYLNKLKEVPSGYPHLWEGQLKKYNIKKEKT